MSAHVVDIVYESAYRKPVWFDDIPSAPRWLTVCRVCGPVGVPYLSERWAQTYGRRHTAKYDRHPELRGHG